MNGDWEQDFPRMLPHCLDDNQPCYILYRLDTRSSHGYDWLLINYAPDCAPIRQKMLVAATRATLKAEFGPGHIRDEVHATSKVRILYIQSVQSYYSQGAQIYVYINISIYRNILLGIRFHI